MRSRPVPVALIGVLVLSTGCYSRSHGLARVTPDAIHFEEPAEPLAVVGEPWPVQEEECAFQVPFVVFSRADAKRVVDNLFAERDGDAIIDAELDVSHLPLVLWDDSCVGIRGKLVRVKEPGAATGGGATRPAPQEPLPGVPRPARRGGVSSLAGRARGRRTGLAGGDVPGPRR